MAPKTDVKKAALKAAKGKSEQAEKKLDQSNFITSLKSSKATEEQKKLLDMYKDLPRFDPLKTTLLQEWKKDKSCKWVHTFMSSIIKTSVHTRNAVSGFGTKCPNKIQFVG